MDLLSFGIFIMTCDLTYVLSIYTLGVPVYGIEGLVKAATAAASIFTAGMLWPLLPKLLTIPSPFEFRQVQEAKKKGASGITTLAPSVAGQWGRGNNRLPG